MAPCSLISMSDILNDPEVWKTKQSTDAPTPAPPTPTIREIGEDKRRFLDLLLLADEQEDMIERYLDRGDLFVMEAGGQAVAVCVVTEEGALPAVNHAGRILASDNVFFSGVSMSKLIAPLVVLTCAAISVGALSGCGNAESPGETAANSFIDAMTALYQQGTEYETDGLPRVANYLYGTADAGTTAMRFMVDSLLVQAGDVTTLADEVGDRLADWDSIAALGYASPYPYLFEGFIDEANGDTDGASTCYMNAVANPGLMEDSKYLKTMLLLDKPTLTRIKTKLLTLEDEINATYSPPDASIPRNIDNFDDNWLRLQAKAAADAGNETTALDYYQAAIAVNPYNGDNYAGAAVVALHMGDGDAMVGYVNDGLLIDPDNAALKTVLEATKG